MNSALREAANHLIEQLGGSGTAFTEASSDADLVDLLNRATRRLRNNASMLSAAEMRLFRIAGDMTDIRSASVPQR